MQLSNKRKHVSYTFLGFTFQHLLDLRPSCDQIIRTLHVDSTQYLTPSFDYHLIIQCLDWKGNKKKLHRRSIVSLIAFVVDVVVKRFWILSVRSGHQVLTIFKRRRGFRTADFSTRHDGPNWRRTYGHFDDHSTWRRTYNIQQATIE